MVNFAASSTSWNINQSKGLSQAEIDRIVADLSFKAQSNVQDQVKLVLFRLSVYCGLRATELCGLNLDEVNLESDFPHLLIRSETAKGGKAREVPILSIATVMDFRTWKALRIAQGATNVAPFLCSVGSGTLGHRFSRQGARNRFKAACKCLGQERAAGLTIHDGRHTCASMSLHKRVPIALVRDMLGHSSIAITNTYTGLFRDGKGMVYNLDLA